MKSVEGFLNTRESNVYQSSRYLSLTKFENNDSVQKLFDTLKENSKTEEIKEDSIYGKFSSWNFDALPKERLSDKLNSLLKIKRKTNDSSLEEKNASLSIRERSSNQNSHG